MRAKEKKSYLEIGFKMRLMDISFTNVIICYQTELFQETNPP